ncbi:IS630 family transposase [Salinispora arenicola]|uniref:IS630 family transposase n=1 Tax=Salinispora arenicola TaxID=168697 RepID=UPI0027DDCA24|nr:IS630 family transposase [Salinispora arenicola]
MTQQQRAELASLVGDRRVDAVVAGRARMELWRDEGHSAQEVAVRAGVSRPTVNTWVRRYHTLGVAGLADRPRPCKPAEVPGSVRARIVALTRMTPPEVTGLTHWSSREMSNYLHRHKNIRVSHKFVADLWRTHGLQPHRFGTFKLSCDPAFADKVVDIVGLYLNPPVGAVVLCVDEKTQVQALTGPSRCCRSTSTAARSAPTTTSATAPRTCSPPWTPPPGRVVARCFPKRRGSEFLTFMKTLAAAYPNRELHVVVDNLSTHTTDEVKAWLNANPRIVFHFTPTGSSWLNMVEIWFGIITRQAIRRGTFTSVTCLTRAITDYVTAWNTDAQPFVWTATPGEILAKVRWVHSEVRKLLTNNDK